MLTTLLTLPLFALLATSRPFNPSRRDAGPSGHLESPTGGTQVTNLGGATGDLAVVYRGVEDGGSGDGGDARTICIDLSLVPIPSSPSDTRSNLTLANGLRQKVSGSSDGIYAWFTPPIEACGPYRLQVVEHQFFNQGTIQFVSAAPEVDLVCGPVQ